ncbi:MAG: alanine racemase [Paenibacillaceae bacterium]
MSTENPISYRDTWAEVSLDAISHNTNLFKSNMKESCLLMAVVKANGYGHGAIEVAQTAITAGADYIGVAILDEALQLRAAGIDKPILVLGYTPPFSVKTAIQNGIALTVFSEQVLDEIIACTEQLQHKARIHLKIDTGMTRIGLTSKEEALSLAKKTCSSRFVILEGIFTHFADVDSLDPSYTLQQFRLFNSYIQFLESNKIEVPIKHCCNSAAAIHFPQMHEDMIRVGIALYGLRPSANVQHPNFPLEQAMQLKTKISAIKHVPKGQPVSYGCTFKPKEDCITATIPIGYADGLSRQLSNKGFALVNHTRVPIIGRVCMDQTMLNVSSVSNVQIGDEVILFGGSKESYLSIDEVASQMDTINYEVVCLIGQRVPRVYR